MIKKIQCYEGAVVTSRTQTMKINQLVDAANALTTRYCKNCKWWDRKTDTSHRRCLSERMNSGDMICDLASSEYEISEGSIPIAIQTWEEFGCVLFEEKE